MSNLGIEANVSFDCTCTEQIFTVLADGVHTIKAVGASGGKGNTYSGDYGSVPGNGASISAKFELKKGDILHIIVGQEGTGSIATAKDGASGGGGGGTFIFKEIEAITDSRYQFQKGDKYFEVLLVAAGGGGSWDESYKGAVGNGQDGNAVDYYSPTNYIAWGTKTNAGTTSTSITAVMGISQYITYNAVGSFYTRNGSTGQGGYGCGGSADDNYTYGGGWYGASYMAYSWCLSENVVSADNGINTGNGNAVITWMDYLVTDRTTDDARYARENQANVLLNKGALNYIDLNRIENVYKYLIDTLVTEGYYIPHTYRNWTEIYVDENGVTQSEVFTDWHEINKLWLEEANRIRLNHNNLGQIFLCGFFHDKIAYSNYLNYVEANTLEDILQKTKETYDNMQKQRLICGTFNCGGDLL